MDLLDQMLDHDHWATRQLLDVSAGLTDAQLDQEFDIGHRTLRETFGHIIFNVPFWGTFLSGQQPDDADYSADAQPIDRSISTLIDFHERTHAAFAATARKLRDDGRLGETYTDHYEVRKSFGGTILMIIEHNEGHRFEVVHMLQRLGVHDVPEVDLGVWEYYLLNT